VEGALMFDGKFGLNYDLNEKTKNYYYAVGKTKKYKKKKK
jgi:hypothetical protein